MTAPKHEEFVVAKGSIEGKARRLARWKLVAELEDMLRLPHPVEANRRWEAMVGGQPLAQRLRADLPNPQDEVRIRITVEDWYGKRTRSRGLNVQIPELERKEYVA